MDGSKSDTNGVRIFGNLWQFLWDWSSWHVAAGAWPADRNFVIFDWWDLGPLQVRKIRCTPHDLPDVGAWAILLLGALIGAIVGVFMGKN